MTRNASAGERTAGAELRELEDRATEYLLHGGHFNPELMDADKVRDLVIDLRNALRGALAGKPPLVGEREFRNLRESVRIEDDRLQAIAEEIGLPKPTDRGGYTGRHTAFTIIAALRSQPSWQPLTDQTPVGIEVVLTNGRNFTIVADWGLYRIHNAPKFTLWMSLPPISQPDGKEQTDVE